MTEVREWKRPQDIPTWRTSDPKEMLGKFLPRRVMKKYTEDFSDEDTGEIVSIEREEVICEPGRITQDELQELTFALQSGDITDVEVCDDEVYPNNMGQYIFTRPFLLEIHSGLNHYKMVAHALDIPQAMQIVIDFASVYLKIRGDVYTPKVTPVSATVLSDHDECIPEDEREDETSSKDYFRVTVKSEWVEDGKLKKTKSDVILPAREVGQAKERMARKLDIMRKKDPNFFYYGDEKKIVTINKAVPFEVDYIIPEEYTKLYLTTPSE